MRLSDLLYRDAFNLSAPLARTSHWCICDVERAVQHIFVLIDAFELAINVDMYSPGLNWSPTP